MKKVYINARFLTQKITGVQRFAIEISKQLIKTPLAPNLCFVAPKNIIHPTVAEELKAVVVGSNTGHLWEQLDLVNYLKSEGQPILINLANSAPFFYSKNVVTIHDLSVFYNPQWFSFLYRNYYKLLTPRIIKNAKLVFTVSNAVKEELINKFHIENHGVEVIYNAVAEKFKIDLSRPKKKKENYILTVSSLDPRKNIRNLIKAFSNLNLPDQNLYIIGDKSSAFAKTDLHQLIIKDKRIKLLGRVSDEQLLQLYANASLFAYISFYEGFGIPNIEAMSMGTPVLTSNTAAIKEICGEAAFYVDPHDIDKISSGISTLLDSPYLLTELSLKGLKKSKEYSWSNSATKFYNAISKIKP